MNSHGAVLYIYHSLWYTGSMTDDETPKRRRGRPKGSKLTEEHKAKLAEAARRQHADPVKQANWRAGMEPVWESSRGPRRRLDPNETEAGVTQADTKNEPQTAAQSRLDLLAAGLEAATGKPVRFVDITDQLQFTDGGAE